ncbi:hypothetical protein Hypma_011835 [Hypsizygus marmoreus]|uniref:DNA-binding protein RAP1 n=1 Tax=Hypsizygus marmoreus TaxID=39966 RepID=A0A369JLE1_HYPMA|nr:hypothetical protein Hypma_011835 [Hypsizygus marmoreus]
MALQREEEEESDFSDSDSGHDADLEKQVFVKDGNPVYFHIHESVKRQFQRNNLTTDIQKYGGIVLGHTEGVETVIVDPLGVNSEALQDSYNCHRQASQRDIWVEPMSFIKACIRRGSLKHRIKPKQGMGGSIGRTRTEFTFKDEKHLCRYIAIKIPEKTAGGRTGNRLYERLLEMGLAMTEEHGWAKRHPWSSWRQHYKMNAKRLDPIIRDYARHYRPTEKQTYDLDRRIGKKKLRNDTDSEIYESSGASDAGITTIRETGRGVKRSRRRSENYSDSSDSERPTKQQRKQHSAKEKGKGRDLGIVSKLKSWQHRGFFNEDGAAEAGPVHRFATTIREFEKPPSRPSSLFSEDEDAMDQPAPSYQHLTSPDRTMVNRVPQNASSAHARMLPRLSSSRSVAFPGSLARRPSTSSVDSFPIPGTRASAAKKRMEEAEKLTPYKPPAGTRAALIR